MLLVTVWPEPASSRAPTCMGALPAPTARIINVSPAKPAQAATRLSPELQR